MTKATLHSIIKSNRLTFAETKVKTDNMSKRDSLILDCRYYNGEPIQAIHKEGDHIDSHQVNDQYLRIFQHQNSLSPLFTCI